MRRAALILAAAILAVAPSFAKEVPYLGGRVNDLAAMLDEAAEQRMEETLAALENDTGAQVAVLTVDSLEGEVLEDYALRVATTWQLGRAEQDDGLLILVAESERRIRFEVGYGLEGVLPDVIAKRIIDGLMTPRFKEGDFVGGVEAAVEAVAGLVRGEAVELPDDALSPGETLVAMLMSGTIFLLVVGLFSVIALFSKGCQGWFLYLFLLPFWGMFPFAIAGKWGAIVGVLWLVGFPILRTMTWHSDWGRSFRRTHPGWVSFAASSASSSGGGGFSGGGGSFGGGGASGGW